MNDRLKAAGQAVTPRFTANPAQHLPTPSEPGQPAGKRKMLTINLPADLHQSFRLACVQRNTPMSAVITHLIRTQLDEWNHHA